MSYTRLYVYITYYKTSQYNIQDLVANVRLFERVENAQGPQKNKHRRVDGEVEVEVMLVMRED